MNRASDNLLVLFGAAELSKILRAYEFPSHQKLLTYSLFQQWASYYFHSN